MQRNDFQERSLVVVDDTDHTVDTFPLNIESKPHPGTISKPTVTPSTEMDQSDFVGSSDALKTLFTMPFNFRRPGAEIVALHRVGDTLIFEDVSGLNEIASSALLFEEDTDSSGYHDNGQHRLTESSQGTPSASNVDSISQLLGLLDTDATDESPRQHQSSDSANNEARRLPNGNLKAWLPPMPRPPLNTHHWKFSDFRIVVGSDLDVYSGEGHQDGVSCRVHPSGEMWEPVTAVDAYLDQIMASIPELALMMESKGYIRGYKLMETRNIPKVDVSDTSTTEGLKFLEKPLFDSGDLELNAANLLRFLKKNCTKNGATYLLQRETSEDDRSEETNGGGGGGKDSDSGGGAGRQQGCVRLFDLSSMSTTPLRKWKWLLAMLSYRFANRTRMLLASARSQDERTVLQGRFRELLDTCLSLLQALAEMGGHGHEMLQGNCHHLLAESHLAVFPDVADTPSTPNPSANISPPVASPRTSNMTVSASSSSSPAAAAAPPPFALLGRSETTQRKVVAPKAVTSSSPPSSPASSRQAAATTTEGQNGARSGGGGGGGGGASSSGTSGGGGGGQWPGRACEDAISSVPVADLEKAQSHLLKGLNILEAMMKLPDEEDIEDDGGGSSAEADEKEGGDSDISASVAMEARRLRLRLVEVTLSLASRQIGSWRASNAMSNLREAASHLRSFAPASKQHVRTGGSSTDSSKEAVAWLWELGSRLCRALAGNRFEWVEKAGVHPEDMLLFCDEVSFILSARGKSPATAREQLSLHSLSFADPLAWQYYQDLHSLPLETAGPPPISSSTPTFHQGFEGGKDSKGGRSSRKGRRRSQSIGGDCGTDAEVDLSAPLSPPPSADSVSFPTPLLIASALCAAKALEAVDDVVVVVVGGDSGAVAQNRTENNKQAFLLKSRLGDGCNEVGKALLRTVTQTPSPEPAAAAAEDRRLFGAMVWFQRGLVCFSADAVNSALLLCNLASAKKLLAGRVPREGKHSLWRTEQVFHGEATTSYVEKPVMDLVEHLLAEAISDCYSAMEKLGERGSDSRTWDHISAELAMAYLTLGVRRRQTLLAQSPDTTPTSATQAVTPGAAKKVAEPLEKAAAIYEGLGDRRQLAAARYQAGTLWSRLWMRSSDPRRGRERLGQALTHYEAAHAYYANDCSDEVLNTTLVMIDLDLCDLYSAVHAASPSGNAECLEKGLLCLLETHRAFAQPSPSLNYSQLVELVRLCSKIAERLPKLLLQLAKASAAATVVPANPLAPQLPETLEFAAARTTAEASTGCFKSLYRASLTFKWPTHPPCFHGSASDMEAELRQDLLRVASFLQGSMHRDLVQLRRRKSPLKVPAPDTEPQSSEAPKKDRSRDPPLVSAGAYGK